MGRACLLSTTPETCCIGFNSDSRSTENFMRFFLVFINSERLLFMNLNWFFLRGQHSKQIIVILPNIVVTFSKFFNLSTSMKNGSVIPSTERISDLW